MNIDILFRQFYEDFNERKIENVIEHMTENIKWANGMDGGYVYGHDGVRNYWINQFTVVSSKVTPLQINEEGNVIKIKVHQVVHDLKRNLLADDIVYHFFQLKGDKISSFDIGAKVKN